jgi:hypothetical protein
MKFNYSILFAAPIFMVMVMDTMFLELMSPNNEASQGSFLAIMVKLSAFISMGYSIYNIKYMAPFMRVMFALTVLYVIGMVFESLLKYNTPLIYPHVFLKVFLFFYTFFIYTYYKKNEYFDLKHVVWFILIGFLLNVILIHPDALSLSAFTNHERGVYATSIYMLVIPFLYFLSKYLFNGGVFAMVMAFFVLFLIIFFQHRTVWISTAFILSVYVLLIKLKSKTEVNFKKLIPIALIIGILGIISSAFVFSIHPEIIEKFQDNFSDIENYDKQGTGGWRFNQFMSYLPFVQDNFVWGMRFEGFELPIQFYRDDLNEPVFEGGNGHHFHSFYLDVLFYIGFVGLMLIWMVKFYAIGKTIKKRKLDQEQILLIAFISSGFIFGLSYVLPYFFYAILGLTVAYLDQNDIQFTSFLKGFARRRHERLAVQRQRIKSDKKLITSF